MIKTRNDQQVNEMSINEADLKTLLKALAFAAHKHKDQRRKDVDASPYINHPISLADILCNEGHITDIETICGALLHDTVEDTETTAEELEREFGKTISNIVMDVTDDKKLPKAARKQAQIDHAAHISEKAKLVKLADKISNLRDVLDNSPADWSLERRQEYFDWAYKVIDQIRGTHTGLEALFDEIYAQRPV
jgi:guanosine-3',5'-bis(diphosphate) 3'-pyrophosphohydrolase